MTQTRYIEGVTNGAWPVYVDYHLSYLIALFYLLLIVDASKR